MLFNHKVVENLDLTVPGDFAVLPPLIMSDPFELL